MSWAIVSEWGSRGTISAYSTIHPDKTIPQTPTLPVFKQDGLSINLVVGRIEAARCPYNKAAMMYTGERAYSAMN